jgi:hypothetical protein
MLELQRQGDAFWPMQIFIHAFIGWEPGGASRILGFRSHECRKFFEFIDTAIFPESIARPYFFMCFCVGGILLGTWGIASIVRSRIILYRDGIEVVGALRHRHVDRKDIGAKMFLMAACPMYYLIPWRKGQRKLAISVTFRPDEAFNNWIASTPDADASFLRNRRRGTLSDNLRQRQP